MKINIFKLIYKIRTGFKESTVRVGSPLRPQICGGSPVDGGVNKPEGVSKIYSCDRSVIWIKA